MLENLRVDGAEFLSDHVSNYLPLYGRLPEDKKRMLAAIEEALAVPDNPVLEPRTIRSL